MKEKEFLKFTQGTRDNKISATIRLSPEDFEKVEEALKPLGISLGVQDDENKRRDNARN